MSEDSKETQDKAKEEYCDITTPVTFDFKKEQEHFFEEFKKELIKRLTPVVNNLVQYLRFIEGKDPGKGKQEVHEMLDKGEINIPMYEILIAALENLDEDYTVNLEDSKYFQTKDKK